ncbi:MAG: cation-efflux pump [Euryarchaeota archaeon]|nr:cation-efflux pump [Euryarchaeota archaeon]
MALGSVIAAILLTVTKLSVGYATNSLGILSEALHSSIDLIAAGMTLYAVRAAAVPPDKEHMYGHEKIESLSALIETLLLVITCAWIVYEAINRLFFHPAEVELGIIAILVMAFSIVIDLTRSRALHRIAIEYKSQALEADAIHFSTDLLSSTAVIVGILFTMAGFGAFDSIAALCVAAITAVVAYRLWRRSAHTLIDGAPAGITERVISEAAKVEGIHSVERVRVRESGAVTFIDVTVLIDKTIPLEQGHRLTELVEARVREAVPGSDIVVHAEPSCLDYTSLEGRIREAVADLPDILSVHSIASIESAAGRQIGLHMETNGDISLERAHAAASALEKRVMDMDKNISAVIIHIEPACCHAFQGEEAELAERQICDTMGQLIGLFPEVLSYGEIRVHRVNGRLRVSMCCLFEPHLSVIRAHEIVDQIEKHIHARHSDVDAVIIHIEPED